MSIQRQDKLGWRSTGAALLLLFCFEAAQGQRETSSQAFDFIIAGGGTAGSVMASRLSENGKHRVLLLHEGQTPDPNLSIPGLLGQAFGANPNTFRVYPGTPQQALPNNRVVNFVAATPLGGGSAVNAMNWARGSPHDYNNWARITGDPSWTYANMLQYFRRSEDYFGGFLSDQHGRGGPVTISRPNYAPGLNEWIEAGRSLGYPSNVDPNGPQQISFAPIEFSQRFGRRISAYHGYIEPFMRTRRNLVVVTNTEVTRVLFEGNRAVGVQFATNSSGSPSQGSVRARKEVIISGGTMGSPILLLRSGIGPSRVLQNAQIPVVRNLPVGRNFQDHAFISIPFLINNISAVYNAQRDLTPAAWDFYNQFGDGPFTSLGGGCGQAFIASSVARREGTGHWPDLQLLNFHTAALPGLIPDRPYIQVGANQNIINCGAMITRMKSRGALSLNSEGAPVLDYSFFSNPVDIESVLEGVRACLQLHERSPVYQVLGAIHPPNPLPECQQFQFSSDAYWRCYIMQTAVSGNHPTSTCPMGRGPRDPNAVVDTNFNVIGMENLRVVDASVMPHATNVNTQATVYAIAEKAAEKILERWGAPTRNRFPTPTRTNPVRASSPRRSW